MLMTVWNLAWREWACLVVQMFRYWQSLIWRVVLTVVVKREPLEERGDGGGRAESSRSHKTNVETDSLVDSVGSARDCWICYDSARTEPLIRPCRCTGDVSAVHHDCLRRWLIESATTPDGLKCKVCNTPYIVQETNGVEWKRGFTCVHWVHTTLAVATMCGVGGAAWVLVQLFPSPVVRVLCAGAALLVCYVVIRFLSVNTVVAYQRAKVSSLKILTEPLAEAPAGDQTQLCTISKTVTVEIASKAVLERALKGDVNK